MLFGGNKKLAISLLSRINACINAETIRDIIVQPQMRFHKLGNFGKGKNLLGYYAIDVSTIRDPWRIIVEPLDDDEKSFEDINIFEIAKEIRIIEIREISKHYE